MAAHSRYHRHALLHSHHLRAENHVELVKKMPATTLPDSATIVELVRRETSASSSSSSISPTVPIAVGVAYVFHSSMLFHH
jgi:hypothetical protein